MLKPETKCWIKTGLNVLWNPAPFGWFVSLILSIFLLISTTAVVWIPGLFTILFPNNPFVFLFSIWFGVAVGLFLFFFLTLRVAYYFYIKGYQ